MDDFNNKTVPHKALTASKSEMPAPDISKITAKVLSEKPSVCPKETWYLPIHFYDGAKMENLRAFMLMGKLRGKGVINRTIPDNPETNPDAAAYIIDYGFYLSYTTSLFREQIEALLKGTLSIETISFVRRMPDEPVSAGDFYAEPDANAASPATETASPPAAAGKDAIYISPEDLDSLQRLAADIAAVAACFTQSPEPDSTGDTNSLQTSAHLGKLITELRDKLLFIRR